jgi:hypothetical protein
MLLLCDRFIAVDILGRERRPEVDNVTDSVGARGGVRRTAVVRRPGRALADRAVDPMRTIPGLSPKETRSRGWDWEFESGFLQRRVGCELGAASQMSLPQSQSRSAWLIVLPAIRRAQIRAPESTSPRCGPRTTCSSAARVRPADRTGRLSPANASPPCEGPRRPSGRAKSRARLVGILENSRHSRVERALSSTGRPKSREGRRCVRFIHQFLLKTSFSKVEPSAQEYFHNVSL